MTPYVVKSGDSLSKIARDVLGDMSLWEEIARINNISNVNLIYPGQVLMLPEVAPSAKSAMQPSSMRQTASMDGWIAGGFLLLLVAGAAYEKRRRRKAREEKPWS